MANEIIITVCGNLTADPEIRWTQGGLAVASFTIASTPRTFDKQKNEWVDGDAVFLRCSVWRDFAEHVAGSLTKGTRVIATGRYKQRPYEDREGNKRTSTELEVDEIGPSLRYATAIVERAARNNGPSAPSAYQQQQDEVWATPQAEEPWATPGADRPAVLDEPWATPRSSSTPAANTYDEEAPF